MSYRAEIFDQMQKLYDTTGFSDHMLHGVIDFETAPDAGRLMRAVWLSLRAVPILATRFVEDADGARWMDLDETAWQAAFALTHDDAVFEGETTRRIPETVGPQVRLCLLAGPRSRLSVSMNHMVADAGGLREYLYLLARCYSMLAMDADWQPGAPQAGDRGLSPILKAINPFVRAYAWLSQQGESNRRGTLAFPLDGSPEVSDFIVTHLIPRDQTARLKAWCAEHQATLNDALLAAYYRVLGRRIGPEAERKLVIPFMIDMRRYLTNTSFTALTNLSSTAVTRLRQAPGDDFTATVKKTKTMMDGLKRRQLGLGGLAKMALLDRWVKPARAVSLIRRGLRHPLICMTNIGPIDSSRLVFDDKRVSSAFLCGSIKYRPHFQMAVSGFDGTLTLSSNLRGSPVDRRNIADFLAEIAAELDQARPRLTDRA